MWWVRGWWLGVTDDICGYPTATDGSPCEHPAGACPYGEHSPAGDLMLGGDVNQAWVYASSQLRPTLHLVEDCPALRQANRVWTVRADAHPNAVVCRRCDPTVDYQQGPKRPRDSCTVCGATLDDAGECGFCASYDEVFAD